MHTQPDTVAVAPRTVQAFDMAPGETLVALEGVVWVTASNRGGDMILAPGDEVRFAEKARAVVGGFKDHGVTVRLAN